MMDTRQLEKNAGVSNDYDNNNIALASTMDTKTN
jgi:hypothetical protein